MKQVRSWLIGDYKRIQNGNAFIPLYNEIEDSYVINSIGCWCVIGVLERNTTLVGVTTINGGFLLFFSNDCRIYVKRGVP